MKKGLFILLGCTILLTGFLFWPSNYYLRKALIYQLPKIDQYPIFENRIVKAEDPSPWLFSPDYNRIDLPESFESSFAAYETIAFLVIKDSNLLFEQYWEDYSPQSWSNSFSMAKSIVSLAAGCALDDGYIRSPDQPVSDFIPGFGSYEGVPLTIRHLLTMSAGVDFQEAYTSPFSPTTKIYYGNDLESIIFNMKQIEKPGVNFVYQSGVTQLLAYVVEKAIGENISDYISRKIWTPIQAEENALWSLDHKDGVEKAYCCFNSNARDFARLGQLILNNGSWNGCQLISADYIRQAITPDSSLYAIEYGEVNHWYGFQFWSLEFEGRTIPYFRGILGQYIFILPEEQAVIVRLGHKRSETRTAQYYPDDIDIWLKAGLSIIEQVE